LLRDENFNSLLEKRVTIHRRGLDLINGDVIKNVRILTADMVFVCDKRAAE